jgi:hypothetical protein
MWRTRTWAVVTVALAALTATTAVAWTDEPAPQPDVAATSVPGAQPQPEPKPQPDKPAAVKWDAAPVWVASTLATLYDISPDGKRFLFSDGRKLGCFDRSTGKMDWQIDNSTIHSAKFSPNGRTIVAGEWQNGLNLYDATNGKSLYSFPTPGIERIWQTKFLPDGTVLYQQNASTLSAPWTVSYTIVHWDPVARKEIRSFSDSIKYENGNMWLWHRGEGFFLERLQNHGTGTTTRKTVSYIDPMTGKATPTIDLNVNDDHLFDLSPDGKTLLVMTVGEDPRLVDTSTGKTKATLAGHKRLATAGAYSPDGKLIATVTGTEVSGFDRAKLNGKVPEGPVELIVWNVATGKTIARSEFATSAMDFVEVRFSPDSKFLVAVSKDGKDGKGRRLVAFGDVPFGETGGAALVFPKDEEKPKPPAGPGIVALPGAVSDPLDRLVEELAKSKKTTAEKVDALFLAALGRFASEREQKWVKDIHGDKLTADVLRKLLAEIAKSPEFEAHIKSLQNRQPPKPAFPLVPYPTYPAVPGGFWPGYKPPDSEDPSIWRGLGWPVPPPEPQSGTLPPKKP